MTGPGAWPLVIGTAGHIDHGKTALVHALTGIDTDRLAVEKERGITTELGFAHLDLDVPAPSASGAGRGAVGAAGEPAGGPRRIAVVDVPGHERFIRSMVAGATGLDLVMLVIAADEGVMPQTREHLDVCALLGVRRGVVVISKRDLVDDDWLAMLDEELTGFLAGGPFARAPRVAVSARTGAGLDELKRVLARELADLPPRPTAGVFRLPLDRVFSLKGFGTVVTGTVASGAVAVGDELVVHPRGLTARVRGLQVHGAAVERALAGQRVAVNVAPLAVDDLARGDVLAHPGALTPAHLLDVSLHHVAAAPRPLPARSKVLVHHGTTQVAATLVLVGATSLAPGADGLGQLRLDRATPLAALPGDRFIVRGFQAMANHGSTIAGGQVVRAHAARSRGDDHAAVVARFAAAREEERVLLEVRAAAAAAPTAADLGRRLGLPADAVTAALAAPVAAGDVLAAGSGATTCYLHAAAVAALERQLLALLDEGAAATPPRPELPREELRQRLPAALPARGFDAVLDGLRGRGLVTIAGEAVRRPLTAPAPPLSPLEADLAARFAAWALEPPRPKEVAPAIGKPEPAVKAALDKLIAARRLVKVKPDLYVDAGVLDALEAKLRAYLDAHREITPLAWKDLTGTSRKYSIPLAEHFDATKVTLRVGEIRRKR